MITMQVKTQGFREMEELLFQLKGATAKNTTARAMISALEPVRVKAKALAPRDKGGLEEGILISRRATKKKALAKSDLEVFCGPRKELRQAVPQEFGTSLHGPSPYMRPAWDSEKVNVLTAFGFLLEENIEKAIGRQQRRAAREAAKLKRGG